MARRLEFDNRSEKWALFSTDFPRLARVTRKGEADAMLPWKDHGARLFHKWEGSPKEIKYQYLGHYPQVAAFFVGDDGLYIAAEDPDARQKTLFVGVGSSLRFHTPVEWGGIVGKAAEGPRYDVVLAPLKGDWWAEGKVVLLAAKLTDRLQTATYAVFDTKTTAELSLKPHELKCIELSHTVAEE